MQKIVSQEIKSKKQRRNQLIIGIILIGLMLVSVGGYAFYGNGGESSGLQKIKYNGYEFNLQNNYWVLKLGGYTFGFSNRPDSINSSEVFLNGLDSYSGEPLYIDSTNNEATYQISMNLDQVAQRIQPACVENSSCVKDSPELPVKTCEDNLIIIIESNSSSIRQENNCVYIEGNNKEILSLVDEFLYKIIGVK